MYQMMANKISAVDMALMTSSRCDLDTPVAPQQVARCERRHAVLLQGDYEWSLYSHCSCNAGLINQQAELSPSRFITC